MLPRLLQRITDELLELFGFLLKFSRFILKFHI